MEIIGKFHGIQQQLHLNTTDGISDINTLPPNATASETVENGDVMQSNGSTAASQ